MSNSNLSFAVLGILSKYKKSTGELADASKLPMDAIHNWRYGKDTMIAPGHMIRLARAFAATPKEVQENHLSLLYAHLRDDCVGPAAKFINIEILPTALPVVATSWSLRPENWRSQLDLEAIAKHIWYDTRLQKVIRDIARPLKSKRIPNSLTETEPK